MKEVEALIYISGDDGILADEISELLNVDIEKVFDVVNQLNTKYLDNDSALFISRYGKKYKMMTKQECYEVIARYLDIKKVKQLSQAALETLAIIAYKQPITRIEIEDIRGVGCDMMIKKLLALDLILEAGRLETPGRPVLYQVSPSFLDVFKLVSLDELPAIEMPDEDAIKELY